MLPDTDREKILAALDRFNRDLRRAEQWQGWEDNRAQKYALQHNGLLYPPKCILSLATDTPVAQFSGGYETNSRLKKHGFTVIRLRNGDAIAAGAPAAAQESTLSRPQWLFQSDPAHYDAPAAVAALQEMSWLVSQHKKHIRPGDRVYLWESGKDAGLIAAATVLTLPALITQTLGEDAYNKKPEKFQGERLRVRLRIDRVLPERIGRLQLQQDEKLKECKLWAGVQGTNFEIPQSFQAALEALVFPDQRQLNERDHALTEAEKEAEQSGAFDPKGIADARQRTLAAVVRRRGQPKFRKKLLEAYHGRCAVTGCNAEQALEAAHIYPYKGDETDHISNGLLLRSDIHTLFDLGFISVNPESLSTILSPQLSHTDYAELLGKPLLLPSDASKVPSRDALNWHFENIYRGSD